jgi:hypothetical protein
VKYFSLTKENIIVKLAIKLGIPEHTFSIISFKLSRSNC